jgi:hypothetical protein
VAKLLISILENAESAVGTRTAAAQAVASLRVQEAAPVVKKALKRVIAIVPTATDRDTEYLLWETVYLVDAVACTGPEDLDKHVTPVLNMMKPRQLVDLFEGARHRLLELNVETLEFLTKTALTMVKADPSIAWPSPPSPPRPPQVASTRAWSQRRGSPLDGFLVEMSERHPAVMLEPRIKELLHELCDAPRAEVRAGIFEIIGNIRDQDALPIVFPKLRASWSEDRSLHYMLSPAGGRVMAGRMFGWATEESVAAWRAVKAIGSPQTTEFLLEKLRSDDIAWVYTAAALLMDIGEGRAIEPLKQRHSELAGTEDEQAKEVLEAIEHAYQELSGRTLTDSDG